MGSIPTRLNRFQCNGAADIHVGDVVWYMGWYVGLRAYTSPMLVEVTSCTMRQEDNLFQVLSCIKPFWYYWAFGRELFLTHPFDVPTKHIDEWLHHPTGSHAP